MRLLARRVVLYLCAGGGWDEVVVERVANVL